jgi:hypothetical protein
MNGVGHQFFTGAALPGNEHSAVAGSSPSDLGKNPAHGRTVADNGGNALSTFPFLLLRGPVQPLCSLLHGLQCQGLKFIHPERLYQVVHGTQFDALDRVFNGLWMAGADAFENFDPIHAGHFYVQQDDADRLCRHEL